MQLKSLKGCRLKIGSYPAFSYNASGGGGEEDEMFSSEDPNDPSVFSSKALYNMGG